MVLHVWVGRHEGWAIHPGIYCIAGIQHLFQLSQIAGTNVMIRARSAFDVCKGTEQALHTETLEDGLDKRQIYAEDQVSLVDVPCVCMDSAWLCTVSCTVL